MNISRKQIDNFFTIDYDNTTTKKDVKHSLKRLVKRGIISKDDMGYSYIQPHQISVDSSTSSDKGYQKVDVQSSVDDVATGGSIEHSAATTDRDIEQPSLDDSILSFIIHSCRSSSSTSITKKQIQKYYDSIVDDYDTTKKNVKHSLKRLIKRNVIVKDGKKKYSYIQHQQSSRDICTVIANTNRSNKRKRQSEERNDDGSASTTESTTVKKKKRIRPRCSVDGCNNQVQNQGVCIKHGAEVKKYTCIREGCTNQVQNRGLCFKHGAEVTLCSHEGCSNRVANSGVCYKHGAKRYICKHEGCTNQVISGGVCIKHGAERRTCSHEGCNNQVQTEGVCTKHGAKKYNYICSHEGCSNKVVKSGVCTKHGAKRNRKKCEHEGCDNIAQRLGVCWKHGGSLL